MDKITVSTFQLFKMFLDAEAGRKYLEGRLWPKGAQCPTCKGEKVTSRKGGYYRCNACKLDFTVRTGTIFERSHVPLHKWIYAMYLLVTARKGISSLQLSKEIGITQKSAWFVLQRLREACMQQRPDHAQGHRRGRRNLHRRKREGQALHKKAAGRARSGGKVRRARHAREGRAHICKAGRKHGQEHVASCRT